MNDAVANLAAAIRSVSAPEQLYSLGATANGLIATAGNPGPVLVAHLIILQIAKTTDGEAIAETDWLSIRRVLDRLAEFVEHEDATRLDALGSEWRAWKRPPPLQ